MRGRSILVALTVLLSSLVLGSIASGQSRTGEGGTEARGVTLQLDALVLSGTTFGLRLVPTGDGWPARAVVRVEVGASTVHEAEVALRGADGALVEQIEVGGLSAPAGSAAVRAVLVGHARAQAHLRVIPGWLAILPPLLAILLAIVLREVIASLVAGVWLGATIVEGFDPFSGLLRTVDTYAAGALGDTDHASIAIFSLLLGGMIGVIARSGGALGLAQVVTRFAKTQLTGALATWLMGLAIFFDDYSNSLLVGTTMRPITDRLRISREKLAFLVDATAAPVSSFALVSSWVGVEVGYIADQYASLGLEGDPYLVFLETIPYRFYPILMLFFGFLLIVMRRDFGPMLIAERRAHTTGKVIRDGADPASDFEAAELAPPEGTKPHWINAALPILVVIATAMGGMAYTGHRALLEARQEATAALETAQAALDAASDETRAGAAAEVSDAERALSLLDVNLRNVFGKANSLKALLWASLLGSLVAILLAMVQRILSLRRAMEAWVAGVRSITLAVMILVLAWSLGEVCDHLHTAQFVIQSLGGWLPPAALSATVFLVAAVVSFATGTSWGTMGILFPLVIPLAHQLAPEDPEIVLASVASILSGSVWGDHCSPISDTTIMSSMASSCDHVDHVRTQLPYAIAVGLVSLVVGEIAHGYGLWGPWVGLLVGAGVLVALVRYVGKPVPTTD